MGFDERRLSYRVRYTCFHRLRGSASTVLTATGQVNGRWRILSHLSHCRVLQPGEFNGMSSQSHVSHCRVLPLGEFTVMIPDPHATLQGAITWQNQCHDRAHARFFCQCGGPWHVPACRPRILLPLLCPSLPFPLFPLLPSFPSRHLLPFTFPSSPSAEK